MVTSRDVPLADGRVVRAHDTGPQGGSDRVLIWHHGSPQTGAPLAPLLEAAAQRGIRSVSYARPSYGGSTPNPGRDVASAADDVAQIADHLGIGEFAVMGPSGGGPHALACAALLPRRVVGAVCLAGLAPRVDGFDWLAGMIAPGGLRAATSGRAARVRYAESDVFDPASFIPADYAALTERWASLGVDAGRATEAGPEGLIDDDVAFAAPWGFALSEVRPPTLLVQGGLDRVVPPGHADVLLRECPNAQLWLRPREGHISVLDAAPAAMDWLLGRW